MSGHSKWNNIKRKKEASDSAKGAVFTKMAKLIMIAVKEGGPDPDGNSKLKDVISKAKAANMPNDNIKRAIQKAAGAGSGDDYEEIQYEGYGPGGIAFMVRTLTNNRNRTAADVRHIFTKFGGQLGVDGSVNYLFEDKGVILISREDFEDEDKVMEDSLEAGASDFIPEEEYYEIDTEASDYYSVKDALEAKGYEFIDSSVGPVAITSNKVEDQAICESLEKMLDMMEENEDIQDVYHNWDN